MYIFALPAYILYLKRKLLIVSAKFTLLMADYQFLFCYVNIFIGNVGGGGGGGGKLTVGGEVVREGRSGYIQDTSFFALDRKTLCSPCSSVRQTVNAKARKSIKKTPRP